MSVNFESIPDYELLPCPHCGVTPEKDSDHHGEWYEHEANGCAHQCCQLFNEDDVKKWNTRTPNSALLQSADKMREALDFCIDKITSQRGVRLATEAIAQFDKVKGGM